jgi:hypothetical protein
MLVTRVMFSDDENDNVGDFTEPCNSHRLNHNECTEGSLTHTQCGMHMCDTSDIWDDSDGRSGGFNDS